MSVSIRLKQSATLNKVPVPGDLAAGELALNINSSSPAAYLKDSSGAVIKLAGPGASDGRYLRIDTATGAQVVNSTDPTEFKGGLKVSGGTPGTVINGLAFENGRQVDLVADGHSIINLDKSHNNKLNFNPLINGDSGQTGYGCTLSPTVTSTTYAKAFHVFRIQGDLEGLTAKPKADPSDPGLLVNFSSVEYLHNSIKTPTTVENVVGYDCSEKIAFGTTENIGFKSNLDADSNKNYNFYATGSGPGTTPAPSYFGGQILTHAQTVSTGVAAPSDTKFKRDVQAAASQLDDVKALAAQLVNYSWNDDAPWSDEVKATRNLGLVAQEVEKVSPKLVSEITMPGKQELASGSEAAGDAVYKRDPVTFKTIKADVIVMKMLGALGEVITRIEALEAKS